MHTLKKYSAFLLLLLTCYGCGPSMDDKEKRNENWIWFVNKETGKGSWVPFGNEMTVPDGNYTAFYSSGKIREKGKIAAEKNIDTIYYFDINETMIKYTVLGDTTYSYYLHDGPYKAYTAKGELEVEGEVKKHHFSGGKWYGSFSHFINVLNVIKPAKISFSALNAVIIQAISQSVSTGDSIIPKTELKTIDSLYAIAAPLAEKAAENAKAIPPFIGMPELQKATVDVMVVHRDLIKNQFTDIIAYMKKGLGPLNIDKIKALLAGLNPTPEEQFSKTLNDFQEKYPLSDEQNDYMRLQYSGLLSEASN